MTGWDVSKMRASHSARYTSTTALQSSTGYSRVWTEGVLCLILAGLVDPQIDRHGRRARSQPLAELTIPCFPTRQLGKSGNREVRLARSYRQQKFTNFARAARP